MQVELCRQFVHWIFFKAPTFARSLGNLARITTGKIIANRPKLFSVFFCFFFDKAKVGFALTFVVLTKGLKFDFQHQKGKEYKR